MTIMTRAANLSAGALGDSRLLRGIELAPVVDLALHRRLHGAPHSMSSDALIDLCDAVNLVGRGGAAFPVARKLQSLRRGRRAVVVNATESEPASFKDRVLISRVPHEVLDGAALVADAIGSRTVHVAVHDSHARAALAQVVHERPDARRFTITVIGGGFVAGEARAVIRALDGGPALPPGRRTLPTDRGVGGAATFLSNAETFAQLALLSELGPHAFAAVGTPAEPGTTLVTVGGAVGRPGVLEIDNGTSIATVLAAAAARAPVALVTGGYHGTWMAPRTDIALSRAGLASVGATLGAGVLLVLDNDTCALGELARVAFWLADQSARQCGPCLSGLPVLASDIAALLHRHPAAGHALQRHAGLLVGRGACAHPDGAVRFLMSGVSLLAGEIEHHQSRGSCGRPFLGELPVHSSRRP